MKHKTLLVFVLMFTGSALAVFPAFAAKKSIYIKPFGIARGLPKADPMGERVQDYISEVIVNKGGYTLTSDDEVKQVMKQEEIRMSLDACYDDACIKKLMESIRTDYIIYGTVSYEEERYFITAKMLDRTGGTVRLARVSTLSFKDKDKVKMASTDLARYLTEGKAIKMEQYEDDYEPFFQAAKRKAAAWFKAPGKKAPVGLSASFVYFSPTEAPFKEYYDSLMGGGLDYTYGLGYYLAAVGGLYYVQGSDPSGDVTVSLNSYSLGLRAGLPLFGFVYPYVGIAGRVTWFSERGSEDKVSYTGYGGDGSAGIAFIVWRTLAVWADYSMSMVALNDEGKSDIGGTAIRGGVMYAF